MSEIEKLAGIMPAIASPCDERDVLQEEEFARLAEHLYEQGVHGLYVAGGTGEGIRLRLEERKRLAEIAVEISKPYGGVVICHVGANNTRDGMELAEHAASAGVDAVSSLPPPHCTHAQITSYYADVARAGQLPTLVYHIPMLTGVSASVAQMLEWLDIEGVVGLKSSDWNLYFARRLRRERPEIALFNGMDEILCPALLYGATGGIGMWYNVFPRLFLGIYDAVRAGEVQRAMKLQERFLDLAQLGWDYGMAGVWEMVMRRQGLARRARRRPRPELDDEARRKVEELLPSRIEAIEEVLEDE